MSYKSILHSVLKKQLIPPLAHSLHKGQAGRICVVGGCFEYTGAPYYASVAALKAGCDLSFVVSSKHATLIKSYSPEIMVYPVMYEQDLITEKLAKNQSQDNEKQQQALIDETVQKVKNTILPRTNTLVVGPGLGRDAVVLQTAKQIIEEAKKMQLPIVVDGDGDGLFLISEEPSIIAGYKRAILTPNAAEFKRISDKVLKQGNNDNEKQQQQQQQQQANPEATQLLDLCKKLGHVTIIRKGNTDMIANGYPLKIMENQDPVMYIECGESGSPRRCGGIGDILAGTLGTFAFWSYTSVTQRHQQYLWNTHADEDEDVKIAKTMAVGAYGACLVARHACEAAFAIKYRGFTAPDVLEQVPFAFQKLFPL